MHGRKKVAGGPSEAELSALDQKAATYSSLVSILFGKRKSGDHSPDVLDLLSKMLKSNPDFYSLWNYRREVLLSQYSDLGLKESAANGDKIPSSIGSAIRDKELELTADGIRKNPKSYPAWHHRKWIIERFDVDFDAELELCRMFLKEDQRNFHCWNYRRHVVAEAHREDAATNEIAFATEKIQENFSNYSAFHHRSVYLKEIDDNGKLDATKTMIENDLQIIENAIFTEPDDQSAWWYHHFLFTFVWDRIVRLLNEHKPAEGKAIDEQTQDLILWLKGILVNQIAVVKSLLDLEEDCKWGMCALVNLFQLAVQLHDLLKQKMVGGDLFCADDSEVENYRTERTTILQKLIEIDPSHSNRYKYLLQIV